MTLGLGALGQGATAGPNDWAGFAFVDLVHANVNIPGVQEIVEGSVAPALAEVDSAGLEGGAKSHAVATNGVLELGGAESLEGLVTAEQSAPPDNADPVVEEILPVPADPLLNASVARATAHARWPAPKGCPTGGAYSAQATSHVADANVITDTVPDTTALVAVNNDQGTTVFTRSTNQLIDVAGGPKKGLKAEALTQLTAVTLFKGGANEFTVNVLAPPVVTAIATGRPGGATVTYSEPILQIVQDGEVLGELNAADSPGPFILPSNPLISLELGSLTKTEEANGTKATGEAALFELVLIPAPTATTPLVRVAIANGFVSAEVPVGGIDCSAQTGPNPLNEAHKDATVADTTAGGTFNYNVVVPNRGTCTLTDVKVVDTVTGPAGTTITDTAPDADSVEGLVATWNDIGPLAPNQTKTLTITVKVPDNAPIGAVYKNLAKITATCDGAPVSKDATYTGPTVGPGGSPGCQLAFSNKAASHLEVFKGESFNYYIHVFNSGGSACNAVTVTDTLIPKVTFVSCTDGCVQNGAKLTWNLGVLAPNSGRTVAVTVVAGPSSAVGDKLGNTAVIGAAGASNKTVTTPGPTVTSRSVLAPPKPAVRGAVSPSDDKLPRTGASTVLALAALTALSGGVLLRRRLRLDEV